MSSCLHKNLCRYYVSFMDDSDLWMVMPLLGAGSVVDIMKLKYPNGIKDEVIIANISFDWKKHVKNDIQEQKPAEILLEKKDKNWLAIILISLLIAVVTVGSLYILNYYKLVNYSNFT